MYNRKIFFFILIYSILIGSNGKIPLTKTIDPFTINFSSKIGDNPFPTNPMNDRARGYLLQGRAQTAVTNYGNFIDIDVPPNGAWGEYAYLYDVSFLAGIPGQSYSSNYIWILIETITNEAGIPEYSIWESQSAYDAWYPNNGDTVFVGILFQAENDYGKWEADSIAKKDILEDIDDMHQWIANHEQNIADLTQSGARYRTRDESFIETVQGPFSELPAASTYTKYFLRQFRPDPRQDTTITVNLSVNVAQAGTSHFSCSQPPSSTRTGSTFSFLGGVQGPGCQNWSASGSLLMLNDFTSATRTLSKATAAYGNPYVVT